MNRDVNKVTTIFFVIEIFPAIFMTDIPWYWTVSYWWFFCYEMYLDVLENSMVRQELSHFRLSSHTLEIECCRYNRVDRNDRLCKLCKLNVVESEYHVMLCCPVNRDLRTKYCILSNFPTSNKFYRIMASKQTKIIRNIAKLISLFHLLWNWEKVFSNICNLSLHNNIISDLSSLFVCFVCLVHILLTNCIWLKAFCMLILLIKIWCKVAFLYILFYYFNSSFQELALNWKYFNIIPLF